MMHPMTEQTASVAEFRKKFDDYVAAVKAGGSVAVTDGDKVIGVFVAAEDYEHMYNTALRDFLRDRLREKATIPHEEVMAQLRAAARRYSKQS